MRYSCLFFPVLLAAAGCAHQQAPEIAGQRIDSQGAVIQKIIRVETDHPHTVLLAPDGPRGYNAVTCRYYFQEGEQPEREFKIGGGHDEVYLNPFLAVSNSPLWVTISENIIWTNRPEAAHVVNPAPEASLSSKPYTSYQVDDLHIFVFDEKGYFRQRTFMALQKGEGKFVPEGETYAAEYTSRDGNRMVLFKSPAGVKKYDVVSDKVVEADPAEDQWK